MIAEANSAKSQYESQLAHWRQQLEQHAVRTRDQYQSELMAIEERRASLQVDLDAMSLEVLAKERCVWGVRSQTRSVEGDVSLERVLTDGGGYTCASLKTALTV